MLSSNCRTTSRISSTKLCGSRPTPKKNLSIIAHFVSFTKKKTQCKSNQTFFCNELVHYTGGKKSIIIEVESGRAIIFDTYLTLCLELGKNWLRSLNNGSKFG